MEGTIKVSQTGNYKRLFEIAWWIAIFTITYNIAEGLISVYFGFEDESLTLFGFGIDSFIEVISGIGVATMIVRIQSNTSDKRTSFEKTALRITGYAFYALVGGLVLTSFYNVWTQHKPETTFWGVVISALSIVVMLALVYGKMKVGKRLNSPAIMADANCTKVCVYMSVILLISSGAYELTQFLYLDVAGTLGLAFFSFTEGRECFEKAKRDIHCHCDQC